MAAFGEDGTLYMWSIMRWWRRLWSRCIVADLMRFSIARCCWMAAANRDDFLFYSSSPSSPRSPFPACPLSPSSTSSKTFAHDSLSFYYLRRSQCLLGLISILLLSIFYRDMKTSTATSLSNSLLKAYLSCYTLRPKILRSKVSWISVYYRNPFM